MIQMQDITIFELPKEVNTKEEIIANKHIPKEFTNYTLSYLVQKAPTIVTPQTKNISPVINYLIEKLKNGTPVEKSKCLELISKGIESKGSSQYLDSGLTDALFNVVDENISKLSEPTLQQKYLRNQINKGKKLSAKKTKKAMQFSDKEIAQKNKLYSLFLIAKIQNLLYTELERRSGLTPSLYDMPATERLISESKNNPDNVIKAAAIGALYTMHRPSFSDDLNEIFVNAQQSQVKEVREYANESLKKLMEEEKSK